MRYNGPAAGPPQWEEVYIHGIFVRIRLVASIRPGRKKVKEALNKSTCADLRQKFLLTRKKIAGILTDFKIF